MPRKEITHREYYAQFSGIVKRAVRANWSPEYLAKCLAEEAAIQIVEEAKL